jgi:hypothetical protein
MPAAEMGAQAARRTRRRHRCREPGLIPSNCGQLCGQALNRLAKSSKFKHCNQDDAFLGRIFSLKINVLP